MTMNDLYEKIPESEAFSLKTDSGFNTAASYLKALHHGDQPTEFMRQDAKWLIRARRFYDSLSERDQAVVDSYSGRQLFEGVDKRQRDKRFIQIVTAFISSMRPQ